MTLVCWYKKSSGEKVRARVKAWKEVRQASVDHAEPHLMHCTPQLEIEAGGPLIRVDLCLTRLYDMHEPLQRKWMIIRGIRYGRKIIPRPLRQWRVCRYTTHSLSSLGAATCSRYIYPYRWSLIHPRSIAEHMVCCGKEMQCPLQDTAGFTHR